MIFFDVIPMLKVGEKLSRMVAARVQYERRDGDDVDRLCAVEEMRVVGVVLGPELLYDAVNHLAIAGDKELH